MDNVGCPDAHDREVGVGVVADEHGGQTAAGGQDGADFTGAADDVTVGQRVAVRGNEETRTAAAGRIVAADLEVDDGGTGASDNVGDAFGIGVEEGAFIRRPFVYRDPGDANIAGSEQGVCEHGPHVGVDLKFRKRAGASSGRS